MPSILRDNSSKLSRSEEKKVEDLMSRGFFKGEKTYEQIIENFEDGFLSIERRNPHYTKTTYFDGSGRFLPQSFDGLNYNADGIDENGKFEQNDRISKLLGAIRPKIADLLLWVNFKKPARDIKIIEDEKDISKFVGDDTWLMGTGNVAYADTLMIKNVPELLKQIGKKSIAIAGAVADCAAISAHFSNEIISLTHAGWQGIVNGVVEQLIYQYKAFLSPEDFRKVNFDISPAAGINYEFDATMFDKFSLMANILVLESDLKKLKTITAEDYLVKFEGLNDDGFYESQIIYAKEELKEKISSLEKQLSFYKKFYDLITTYDISSAIKASKNDKSKVILYIGELVKLIMLAHGVKEEQINLAPVYTTDFDNSWPSYRVYSLIKNGKLPVEATKKSGYDARIGVFNVISLK